MDVSPSAIIDLRNNYATLFDMITKNLDKVTKPKGDNDGGDRITTCELVQFTVI